MGIILWSERMSYFTIPDRLSIFGPAIFVSRQDPGALVTLAKICAGGVLETGHRYLDATLFRLTPLVKCQRLDPQ